ncbi:choice-of-anchor D domain-containing protein, partial [Paucibacter sp. APW11]
MDQRPADLLLRVSSPTGLQTRLTYTTVGNPTQGLASDGSTITFATPRYSSGRTAGQSIFPKADVAFPMNVVATVEADTGIAGGALRTEYAYKGLRVATNGRGLLGFMQVNQQNPAPDGSQLNVLTDYFQDHPYTGVAAVSQTFKGPLGSTASRLSRSTNGYCEGTANAAGIQINNGGVAPTPCASSALVQRPYLAQSLEEGWDVNGEALPIVRKTSTYNGDGDPLTITIQTSGSSAGQSQTFTKQVSNSYETADSSCAADNKSCSWILGRLKRATVSNTVPNLLPSLTASAGSNANATAIAGTLTLPSSATAELTASLAINNIALNTTGTAKATLANNGTAALTVSAINASSVTGAGFSFQSTDCTASLAAKTSCSITVGFTPTVAGSATGKLTINTALGSRETALTGSSALNSSVSLDHVSPKPSGTYIPAYSTTTLAVYYRNNGAAPVALSSFSSSSGGYFMNAGGGNGSCDLGLALAPGKTCWVLVGWGGAEGAVTTDTQATFGSSVITQRVSAIQQTLSMTVENNGASTAGTADMKVTLSNPTPGHFKFGAPKLKLNGATGQGTWTLYSDSCGAMLNANASCQMVVRYTAGA